MEECFSVNDHKSLSDYKDRRGDRKTNMYSEELSATTITASDTDYCFWSVASGRYAQIMAGCVSSARRLGITTDFHVWTDKEITGACNHNLKEFKLESYMFKFRMLKSITRKIKYKYYIWIDADTYFVRKPESILDCLQGSPIHSSLESNVLSSRVLRSDWWGCQLDDYVKLMWDMGVRSRAIYNVNAGFWIVNRDAIELVVELAEEFFTAAKSRGYNFTEEPSLAYVTHMLCGNPGRHNLRLWPNLWASDWKGVFANTIPADRSWEFIDYISGEPVKVNPSIVHAMRSKKAIGRAAQSRGSM